MIDINDVVNNLYKLREKYNLTQNDIDFLAKFTSGKYSRIENKTQILNLEEVNSIAKLYGIPSLELLNPNLVFPKFEKLPLSTQEVILKNKPSSVKNIQRRDLNKEVLYVLSNYTLEDTFTSFEIITKLPQELSKEIKIQSIEWSKGILKGKVEKTDIRRIGTVTIGNSILKSERKQDEYRLVKLVERED